MRSLVLAAVVVVMLAGCTPAAETAGPTGTSTSKPTATAVPSATPTPTATPTPSPTRPALSELVLSPGGFDELPLGVDPATLDPAIAVITVAPGECTGIPLAHASDAYGLDSDGHPPFWVALRDGLVAGIQVAWSAEIHTAQGVSVGSTRQQVLDAYPGIAPALSDSRHDVYIVQDDRGWMRMSVSLETNLVADMLAAPNDVAFFAPSFHPIGSDCV